MGKPKGHIDPATGRNKREVPKAPRKANVGAWIKQTAKNDANYGRDSKGNPNNTKNGKWK